jgi:hypothetical protein
MPSFTFAHSFTDDVASDADDVMENIYDPKASTHTSLDIINGWLDVTNKDSADNIGRQKVQPLTFARPQMVGATANLDYMEGRWWQGVILTGGDDDTDFLAIPGGSISYYLPWNATMVMICWQLSWGTDSASASTNAAVKLFTDSVGAHDVTRRQASIACGAARRYGKSSDMWYAGHHTLMDEDAGWKHASLRICSDATQTRVRVRNMIVIPFR